MQERMKSSEMARLQGFSLFHSQWKQANISLFFSQHKNQNKDSLKKKNLYLNLTPKNILIVRKTGSPVPYSASSI